MLMELKCWGGAVFLFFGTDFPPLIIIRTKRKTFMELNMNRVHYTICSVTLSSFIRNLKRDLQFKVLSHDY